MADTNTQQPAPVAQAQPATPTAQPASAPVAQAQPATPTAQPASAPVAQAQPVPHTTANAQSSLVNSPQAQALSQSIQQGNVPGMVTAIIEFAIAAKSSDIHIEPQKDDVRLRYRIDGMLKEIVKYSGRLHPAVVSRVKIISNLKIDEQRIPQDGRASFTAVEPDTGRKIEADLRVSSLPTVNGEKIVMRIQDKTKDIPSLDDLGLQYNNRKFLDQMLKEPNGIMLVSGPTGSGKTTTLYSSLNVLNKADVNIMTIEDPVEYQMQGLNQSQVKPDIGYDFAYGLRTALRQDPDIIMIGEIRDKETIDIAIRAALTGHLVLSTIHTNSAVDTITRLINMDAPGYLISASVRCIVAQRLVRKICTECQTSYTPEPPIVKDILQTISTLPKDFGITKEIVEHTTFVRGGGCANCNNSGYKGRLAIYEILPIQGDLLDMIASGASRGEMQYTAMQLGMTTLKQDGIIKVLAGKTTIEEVYRISSHT